LFARFTFLATLCQRKNSVNSIPKLRKRALQVLLLVNRPPSGRKLLLSPESVIKVFAHPLELRPPRGERITLPGLQRVHVEHVAHGDADGIQLILDAQKLQRILAVPVDQVILQLPQAGDSSSHIPRVSHYRQKRNNQTDVERRCRRSSRRLHCERI